MDRQSLSMTATEVKNEFGRALEQALRGKPVVITKQHKPKAVLLSFEDYQALSQPENDVLAELRAEYDARLETMQTPKARRAMDAALRATPRQMGQAAVKAARKRV